MTSRLRIGITGANGMIGECLTESLSVAGHELTLFVRKPYDSPHKLSLWHPYVGQIEAGDIDGLDVVIHLAGKNLAAGRWTDKLKKELVESRVHSGELLSKTIASASPKPRLLVSMSAVGYYGTHPPDQVIDESSPAGTGFLAELCRKWEAATQAAEDAGVRTVHLRTGVVMSPKGGALAKMLPIFRAGLGGKLGSGEQVWSWLALAEIPGIVNFLIENDSLSGAVNNCTPNPVSNAEMTKILGKVLGRSTRMSVPAFAVKAAMGSELAEETALNGARVMPQKLIAAGYQFKYPELEAALRHELAKAH